MLKKTSIYVGVHVYMYYCFQVLYKCSSFQNTFPTMFHASYLTIHMSPFVQLTHFLLFSM